MMHHRLHKVACAALDAASDKRGDGAAGKPTPCAACSGRHDWSDALHSALAGS